MLLAAKARTESRDGHKHEDFPGQNDNWTVNQTIAWRDGV
ncbi:MAG: hypothetical protein ACSLEN_07035 [Candidatus Malihini olakiniferum]